MVLLPHVSYAVPLLNEHRLHQAISGSTVAGGGVVPHEFVISAPPSIMSKVRSASLGRRMLIESSSNDCGELKREHPEIVRCEPNRWFRALNAPNDPLLPCSGAQAPETCQWALSQDLYVDVRIRPAWENGMGAPSTLVAVMDTGARLDHPELASSLWVNPGEVPGNDIDDDLNGYVDDVHGVNVLSGGSPFDDHVNTHGTHVSGIIAARCNNSEGICGVASGVKLIPIKFLNTVGFGTTASALAAFEYMLSLKRDYGHRIVVSNNSWGGLPYSAALAELIIEAEQLGIHVVAAAGNSQRNIDVIPSYPASYLLGNVTAVAASRPSGALALFSNFGPASVHLSAPGEGILSLQGSSSYIAQSGTSMAAPHVSAVLALMHSVNPSLSVQQAREILFSNGSEVSELGGLLQNPIVVNAEAAVQVALSATPFATTTPTMTPTPTSSPTTSATPVINPTPVVTPVPTPTPLVSPTVGGAVTANLTASLTGLAKTRRGSVKRVFGRGRSGGVVELGLKSNHPSAAEIEIHFGGARCLATWVALSPEAREWSLRMPRFQGGMRALRVRGRPLGSAEERRVLARARVAPSLSRTGEKVIIRSARELCRPIARAFAGQ